MNYLSKVIVPVAIVLASAAMPVQAAESIYSALSKAYENNSTLNAARAGLRATDENVALAKSGYRPTVAASGDLTNASRTGSRGGFTDLTFGIEIRQSIFDGFQTRNSVSAAKSQVAAERANLENTEQNTLFSAAEAFMNVIQFRQIEVLRRRNLEFLREQLRAARARFDVGEGTRTDVAQAEASLAAARAQLTSAEADTAGAEAIFVEIIGTAPGSLKTPKPLSKLLPKSLDSAQAVAASYHPAIRARDALVDSGVFSVKQAEGAFLPQLDLNASLSKTFSSTGGGTFGLESSESESASIGARVTIPIYQGGAASATVRQRKEQLGQARIEGEVTRDQVRRAVTTAWTQLDAARALLRAQTETVRAQRLALQGVIEERNVGQRTTLDVLNAQANVLDAQVQQVQAERGVVVASYGLASAVGKLSARRLGLKVEYYDPKEHYEEVKDAWFGLRTPDGR